MTALVVKNFKAAGTKKKQEKINPKMNNTPEPKLTGKTISRSFFVRPGIRYNNN